MITIIDYYYFELHLTNLSNLLNDLTFNGKLDRMPFANDNQWQIQDFPQGGALTLEGGANLLFDQFSPKLYENEEILGQGARVRRAP